MNEIPSPDPAKPESIEPAPEPTPEQPAGVTGDAPEAKAASPRTAAAAKVKPPAPEDRPFGEFVPQLLLPALAKELEAYGGPESDLHFESGPMPVVGGDCWMVKGALPGDRRFWLCFTAEDINSVKTIALAEGGGTPSLLEAFLGDEKKMSLPLLVSRLVQRLNGQKWLGPN